MTDNGKSASLLSPYGGRLVDLVARDSEREALMARAAKLPSIKITMRNLCDLELLATGGFSPLMSFMCKADYERVLREMRLADGTLWPLPITLTADPAELPTVGEDVVLRNSNNDVIAIMTLDEVFHWDAETEAARAYGSTDPKHPMISEMARWGKVCISGPSRSSTCPNTTISWTYAARRPRCASCSKRWGMSTWWPSRPVIPYTASTRN
jgi:sulfate adenylyltransferase